MFLGGTHCKVGGSEKRQKKKTRKSKTCGKIDPPRDPPNLTNFRDFRGFPGTPGDLGQKLTPPPDPPKPPKTPNSGFAGVSGGVRLRPGDFCCAERPPCPRVRGFIMGAHVPLRSPCALKTCPVTKNRKWYNGKHNESHRR